MTRYNTFVQRSGLTAVLLAVHSPAMAQPYDPRGTADGAQRHGSWDDLLETEIGASALHLLESRQASPREVYEATRNLLTDLVVPSARRDAVLTRLYHAANEWADATPGGGSGPVESAPGEICIIVPPLDTVMPGTVEGPCDTAAAVCVGLIREEACAGGGGPGGNAAAPEEKPGTEVIHIRVKNSSSDGEMVRMMYKGKDGKWKHLDKDVQDRENKNVLGTTRKGWMPVARGETYWTIKPIAWPEDCTGEFQLQVAAGGKALGERAAATAKDKQQDLKTADGKLTRVHTLTADVSDASDMKK